jgi:hypothetical protein
MREWGDGDSVGGSRTGERARVRCGVGGQHFDMFDDGARHGRFTTITGTARSGQSVVLQPRYKSQGMNLHAV